MLPIDSDMFFGREKEMRRIEDMLSGGTPQSVSIIGERRIGKSSLAFRVFNKMKKAENTIAVFMDCDGLSEECKTKDQFFQLLNQKFLEVSEPFYKKVLTRRRHAIQQDGRKRSFSCSLAHPAGGRLGIDRT